MSVEQSDEIREAFQLFDSSSSGVIDIRELRAALRALGFDVKKEQIVELLNDIGKNLNDSTVHDIKITIDDFLHICTPLMSTRDSTSEIEKIFRLFDSDNTGYITYRTLRRVCNELGETQLSDSDVQEMIDQADRTGTGKINLQDFTRIMKKRSGSALDQFDSDDD